MARIYIGSSVYTCIVEMHIRVKDIEKMCTKRTYNYNDHCSKWFVQAGDEFPVPSPTPCLFTPFNTLLMIHISMLVVGFFSIGIIRSNCE